jgi:hypothetical protein
VTGHSVVVPLPLPSVARRQARRDGWLAVPREPFRLSLGEGDLSLQPAAVEPRRTGPLLRLDAVVAGRAASLWCPRELVDALLRDSFALAPADADPALLPLLVEAIEDDDPLVSGRAVAAVQHLLGVRYELDEQPLDREDRRRLAGMARSDMAALDGPGRVWWEAHTVPGGTW